MKITVHEFMSLDGVIQGPGGRTEDQAGGFERGGWVVPFADEEFGAIVDGWFSSCDALLLGRSTYQMMYAYWSKMTGDDRVTQTLNHGRKYLVTSTLDVDTATWDNTTIVPDGLDGVGALKEQDSGELQVHGSWKLAHSLHNAGLVDEYRLLVFPIVIGDGKRLFDDASIPCGFEVVDRATTNAGATALRLRPKAFETAEIPDPSATS